MAEHEVMAESVTVVEVEGALARIADPCSIATGVPITLPDMGLVKKIDIDSGAVTVVLQLTSPLCFQMENIVNAVKDRVGELAGVSEVKCEIDPRSEWMPDMIAPASRAALRRVRPLDAVSQPRTEQRGRS